MQLFFFPRLLQCSLSEGQMQLHAVVLLTEIIAVQSVRGADATVLLPGTLRDVVEVVSGEASADCLGVLIKEDLEISLECAL